MLNIIDALCNHEVYLLLYLRNSLIKALSDLNISDMNPETWLYNSGVRNLVYVDIRELEL